MCQFVETVKVVRGEPQNLSYHEERLNRTCRDLWGQEQPAGWLSAVWETHKAGDPAAGLMPLMKLRVVYGREGLAQVTCEPYVPRRIGSLRLVADNHIAYTYKSTDRTALNRLYARRGPADDVLIVKDGLLTDTSFCNIALHDGSQWVTPRTPLLRGTARARLLDKGLLVEGDVPADGLGAYSRVALFNAMLEFGQVVVDISRVNW